MRNFFKDLTRALSSFVKSIGISGTLPLLIASLGVLLAEKISSNHDADKIINNTNLKVNAGLLTVALATLSIIFMLTLKYLNGSRSDFNDANIVLKRAQQSLQELRHKNMNEFVFSGVKLSAEDQKKIRNQIDELIKNITESSVIDQMKNSIKSADLFEKSSSYFNISLNRINSEIRSLQSRAALNLSIGIVATLVGISALSVFVFIANYQSFSINQFAFHFFPRLSLVIFIQVFAFFFLKIYKSNMDEIKYFHNELTGIEAHISAVALAISLENQECLLKLIAELSTVDRNRLTEKSEKVDLDKSTENLTKLIGAIAPLIKK